MCRQKLNDTKQLRFLLWWGSAYEHWIIRSILRETFVFLYQGRRLSGVCTLRLHHQVSPFDPCGRLDFLLYIRLHIGLDIQRGAFSLISFADFGLVFV